MGMPEHLILVRHGESVGNEAIAKARTGVAVVSAHQQSAPRLWRLTDKGREQAERAGVWLREQGLDRFDRHYCSPYVRAMQTASLLDLPDASWWLEPLLRERDRGYEYVAEKRELAAHFPDSTRTKEKDRFLWRPAGGESIPDVDLRLREVLATLAREVEGGRVICVTHEDAMDALRFRLEKMTISYWTKLAESGAEPIRNGWILHYTRRDPEAGGEILPKFGWFRLVDPAGKGGFPWRTVDRRRFANKELADMVDKEGVTFADP